MSSRIDVLSVRAMGIALIAVVFAGCSEEVLVPEGLDGPSWDLTVSKVSDGIPIDGFVGISFLEDGLVSKDRPKFFTVPHDKIYRVAGGQLREASVDDLEVGAKIRVWFIRGDRSSALRALAVVIL